MLNTSKTTSPSLTQGDSYRLPISLEVNSNDIDLAVVGLIEFSVGALTKKYPDEVTYDTERKVFLFPLTQSETFRMQGSVPYQCRIKFSDGNVLGTPIYHANVRDSISKVVI